MFEIDADSLPVTPAVEALRAGLIVAYITESVFGLAADARNWDACRRLCELKGRATNQTLPIQVAAAESPYWVFPLPPEAKRLFDCFSPGPITVIVPYPGSDLSPHTVSYQERGVINDQSIPGFPTVAYGGGSVCAEEATVGLRIPSHPVSLAILREFGGPIACTSVNPTGQPPASDPETVREYFPDGIEYLVYGHPLPSRLASTVVDSITDPPTILREGVITEEDVRECLRGLDG